MEKPIEVGRGYFSKGWDYKRHRNYIMRFYFKKYSDGRCVKISKKEWWKLISIKDKIIYLFKKFI